MLREFENEGKHRNIFANISVLNGQADIVLRNCVLEMKCNGVRKRLRMLMQLVPFVCTVLSFFCRFICYCTAAECSVDAQLTAVCLGVRTMQDTVH